LVGSVAALALTRSSAAAPQGSVGLTLGGAVEHAVPGPVEGAFHVGGRADLLLGRGRGYDMALGPYLDVASSSFRDVDIGAGAEWLIPLRDDLPVVVSGGAFARNGEGRSWAPGLESTVFFGSRSYNFHSWYGLAAGLFVQARWIPSPAGTVDVLFGLQLDAELLAVPAMLLWGLLK
jgi:hypothetical protein